MAKLLRNKKIFDTTVNLPFPYKIIDAQKWIAEHALLYLNLREITFAIRSKGILIGAIVIRLDMNNLRGDIGFWIGVNYWNKGFCTEAAAAIIKYGFNELKLNKITAQHMINNSASGRVMQKCEMEKEGYLKQHYLKDGKYIDCVLYGITRNTYMKKQK